MAPYDTSLYTLAVRPFPLPTPGSASASSSSPASAALGALELAEVSYSNSMKRVETPVYHALLEKDGKDSEGRDSLLMTLGDALTTAKLASARTLGPKLHVVQLDSPPLDVECKSKGMMRFEWAFKYEGHKFEWSRDVRARDQRSYTLEINMGRHDSNFEIATWRPIQPVAVPAGEKPAFGEVQFLDYNIGRLENPPLEDKKGLELVTIASLLLFLPHVFALKPPTDPDALDPRTQAFLNASSAATSAESSSTKSLLSSAAANATAMSSSASSVASPLGNGSPASPLWQPKKTALSPNEVLITDCSEAALKAYVDQVVSIFQDASILFVVIMANRAQEVGGAVKVAAEAKTARYRASGEELVQYTIDDDDSEEESAAAAAAASFKRPPSSLKIYLSRLPLDELMPGNRPKKQKRKQQQRASGDTSSGSGGGGGGGPKLRPPINFDQPAPARARPPATTVASSSSSSSVLVRGKSPAAAAPTPSPGPTPSGSDPGGGEQSRKHRL